jgi:hypothetical protein
MKFGSLKFTMGDLIAAAGLLLGGLSLGWQITVWARGPEVSLFSLNGRIVELVCIVGPERCWLDEQPFGQVALIVPIFAANTGGEGQNEVIERATVRFDIDPAYRPTLEAVAQWGRTSGGEIQGDIGPFAPIALSGGGAAGGSFRFASMTSNTVISWQALAQRIIAGETTAFTLTLTLYPHVDRRPLTRHCRVEIDAGQRRILQHRRDRLDVPYLSLVCRE